MSTENSSSATSDNSNPSVITYRGNVYTVVGTAGYALDKKTDVNAEYTYSRSDNFTDNSAAGLPLGLDYQRHGLLVGLIAVIPPAKYTRAKTLLDRAEEKFYVIGRVVKGDHRVQYT